MKNMRKLLCALLVVATVVCFMPAMAFAETGSYTVTLKAGAGVGEDITESVLAGDYSIPACPSGFKAPAGKEFDCWVLTEDSTGGSTTGGSTTGGSTTGGSTTGGSGNTGGTVPGTNPVLTLSLFAAPASVSAHYKPGDTYTVKGNITLTAQWKDKVIPGGGGVYVPVDTQSAAKTEANNAVKDAAAAGKYEEAEQAEIQAILDKAAKDIAAAKTAEEIKAIKEEALKAIEAIDTAEEKALIREIEAVGKKEIIAKSKNSTLNGKIAVKLTWTVPEDIEFDGFDIFRSTERYSGFGTKPFFSTSKTSYKNNKDLEVGNTYYYKVRAYKVVNGRKVYTGWSTKAWRTV